MDLFLLCQNHHHKWLDFWVGLFKKMFCSRVYVFFLFFFREKNTLPLLLQCFLPV